MSSLRLQLAEVAGLLTSPARVHPVYRSRILKGGGEVVEGSDASIIGMYYVGDHSPVPGMVWLCLSSSIFVMMPYVALCMFTPFEKLNIFLLSVSKMLKNDLMVFFIIFATFILDFYMTLYILYPRSGAVYMPQVLPFNKMYNGIRSLFELAFTGSPSVIDLDTDFTQLNRMQMGAWAPRSLEDPRSRP